MKFLVVCNHRKWTVEAVNPMDARGMIECKKCKVFDLEKERWVYRDVRVYRWLDDRMVRSDVLPVRVKAEKVDQLDWVGA